MGGHRWSSASVAEPAGTQRCGPFLRHHGPVGSAVSIRLDPLERYAVAANAFAVLAERSDLRAPVASCPDWTVYDLVVHLANVHAWAATIVETGESAAEQNDEPRSRSASAVSRWYVGKAVDLLQVLRAAQLDASCWNFVDGLTGTARFWPRRQMHETTVHLLDLEAVRSPTPPVNPVVATDGIDEVLTVFLRRMQARGRPAALTTPISLVATDVDRAWTVLPPPQVPLQKRRTGAPPRGPGPIVLNGRRPGADVVSAPADVLYRALWKRLPPNGDVLAIEGDAARVQAFLDSPLVP